MSPLGPISVILAVFASFISMSMVLSLAGVSSFAIEFLAQPGTVLFDAFHLAALYIPVFLFVLAFRSSRLSQISRARTELLLFSLGIVPMMVMGLFFRLLLVPGAENQLFLYDMVRGFTKPGALLTLGLVGLFLILLLVYLSRILAEGNGPSSSEDFARSEPEEVEGADGVHQQSSQLYLPPAPPQQDEEVKYEQRVSGSPIGALMPVVHFPNRDDEDDEQPIEAETKVDEQIDGPANRPEEPSSPDNVEEEEEPVFFFRSQLHSQAEDENLNIDDDDEAWRHYSGPNYPEVIAEPGDDLFMIDRPSDSTPVLTEMEDAVSTADTSRDSTQTAEMEYRDLEGEGDVSLIDSEEVRSDSEMDPVYNDLDDEDLEDEDFEESDFDETDLGDDVDEGFDAIESEPTQVAGSTMGRYQVPIDGILNKTDSAPYWIIDEETVKSAETLRATLQEFGIQAEVTGIRKGPVITMFEILPAPGVKLQRIVNLSDNIALRLAAKSVRIVAPIPGKHAVGIEIPNRNRHLVGFGELLQDPEFAEGNHEIPMALGKDISGDAQIIDIAKTPHMLIAGATGSGKSVCVNSLICSILFQKSPQEVKLLLIDPKIVELKFYNDIPHLLTPVITEPKKAFQALQWCIFEMERRYSLLDGLAVRDIKSYNKKIKARRIAAEPLPYLVVVIDEFADLMATSGKELESTLARLAAMSRAVGIHLVLATQRPSTDVITGLIKANIPSRIAFMVSSKVDSRIILDGQGADKLLGRGDMLFTSSWSPFPMRMQGAFLDEEEVERMVKHVKTLGSPDYIDDEIFVEDDDEDALFHDELEDPLLEKAIDIVITAKKASASYLQRRLKVGYNRAARLVEEMENQGIVGPANGSKPREILRAGPMVN